jgi:RNA polymerase sigma-70 factor, ECF subfamily
VLALYDVLLARRGDPAVRLNRVVALAEVAGVDAALDELQAVSGCALTDFLSYRAVRADLLRRVGRIGEARAAYDAALALDPAVAEWLWLQRRRDLVAP